MKLLFFLLFTCSAVWMFDSTISTAKAGVNKCRVNGKIVYQNFRCKENSEKEKISHASLRLKQSPPLAEVGNLNVHRVRSDWDCSSIESTLRTVPSRRAAAKFIKQIKSMDKDTAEKLGGVKTYNNSTEITIVPTTSDTHDKGVKCEFTAKRTSKRVEITYWFSVKNSLHKKNVNFKYINEYIDLLKTRGYNLSDPVFYKSSNSSYKHKWNVANTSCWARLDKNLTTDKKFKSAYFHVSCNSRIEK